MNLRFGKSPTLTEIKTDKQLAIKPLSLIIFKLNFNTFIFIYHSIINNTTL
jgi:hypothetical protein